MRKSLLYLVASILLLSCGQKEQPPLDSVVKWNPGDIKGKVKSIIATSYQPVVSSDKNDTAQLQETDVILQVYNTKGELSESRWYDRDSTLIQRILFEYDLDGLLIRSDYIDYQKDAMQIDSSYLLFAYNDNKKPIKEEAYHNGKILRWSETEYNDNNDIMLHKSYQNGNLVSQTAYEYTYNDDGRKTEEKIYDNSKLTLTMSWVYDEQGRTTAIQTKDGEVSFTESYRYDTKNRLVEETLAPNGNEMKRITIYLYDQNDNMVEYLQKTEDGNILKCYNYTYDEQGNWIRYVERVDSTDTICERKIEYYQGDIKIE